MEALLTCGFCGGPDIDFQLVGGERDNGEGRFTS